MASIKNIVKVMNFHSLVRVDKAKRDANKYFEFERDITRLLYIIVNNRNIKLDKSLLLSNNSGMDLNIYVGNDLGFCGSFNSQIYSAVKNDKDNYKIIIGKKICNIVSNDDKVLFKTEKEDFENKYSEVEKIIKDLVLKKKIKSINIIYNHYKSVSSIEYDCKKVFPIDSYEEELDQKLFKTDFITETDIEDFVSSLIVLYICYNIKILECNSVASENVMRERITRESIKKIDELETEKEIMNRINEKEKNFKRQISLRQEQ